MTYQEDWIICLIFCLFLQKKFHHLCFGHCVSCWLGKVGRCCLDVWCDRTRGRLGWQKVCTCEGQTRQYGDVAIHCYTGYYLGSTISIYYYYYYQQLQATSKAFPVCCMHVCFEFVVSVTCYRILSLSLSQLRPNMVRRNITCCSITVYRVYTANDQSGEDNIPPSA